MKKNFTAFNAYILVEQASSIALLHAKPGSTLLALCYYSASANATSVTVQLLKEV